MDCKPSQTKKKKSFRKGWYDHIHRDHLSSDYYYIICNWYFATQKK